jgi:hypothetical protein
MTVLVGALSLMPYDAAPADTPALLRLAWRTRGVRVEECRRLTEEELAGVPEHMRLEEECDGRILPYRLEVVVDGDRRITRLVRAAGARADRPLYVLEQIPLPAGTHQLDVHFVRQGTLPPQDSVDAATPARLRLTQPVTLARGEIALVTYDAERRALVLRTRG